MDFALCLDDGQRFRVNAYYQKGMMAAALRAIPSEIPDPQKMGITEEDLAVCRSSSWTGFGGRTNGVGKKYDSGMYD